MALLLYVCRENNPYQWLEEELQYLEKDILMRVIVTLNRSHEDRRYSGRRKYYQERGGRSLDRGNNQGRSYPGGGRPPNNGAPPNDGGPLMMEDRLIVEDPLMMEDPQEMEDCQEDLEDKDCQVQQDLLDQCIL